MSVLSLRKRVARKEVDEAVNINALERYVADTASGKSKTGSSDLC